MEDTKRPHVVVVGGGFGGLAAVHALRKAPVDVTLVDRQAYNAFQPLLYQVATGGLNPGDITYFLRSISARQGNARFSKGSVERVDPAAHTVWLDSGVELGYDYLIVASGVTTNYFGIPGAEEHAMAMYTRPQALAVRDRVFATLEAAAANGSKELRIVVVGGGATGVEMAGALAELRNHAAHKVYPELEREQIHITLVEMLDTLLPPFPPKLQRYAIRQLERRGVELRLSTSVKEVRADAVVADGGAGGTGEEIPADVVIWATGVMAPNAVGDWGMPQDRSGRILVDADLRVRGLRDVFAVGDVAVTPDRLAQVAQPAIQGGRHAGRQVVALLAGRQTMPFHYRDKGTLATIGRSAAVADISKVPNLTGFVAWVIWLFVHIMSLLGNRNRLATIVNLSVRYLAWPRTFNVIVGEVPTPRHRDE